MLVCLFVRLCDVARSSSYRAIGGLYKDKSLCILTHHCERSFTNSSMRASSESSLSCMCVLFACCLAAVAHSSAHELVLCSIPRSCHVPTQHCHDAETTEGNCCCHVTGDSREAAPGPCARPSKPDALMCRRRRSSATAGLRHRGGHALAGGHGVQVLHELENALLALLDARYLV